MKKLFELLGLEQVASIFYPQTHKGRSNYQKPIQPFFNLYFQRNVPGGYPLNQSPFELLPMLRQFSNEYCLVGGTAVALHLGHRRSIDVDLFTNKPIQCLRNKRLIEESGFKIERRVYEDKDSDAPALLLTFSTFHSKSLLLPILKKCSGYLPC